MSLAKPCPICGSSNTELRPISKGGGHYVECLACHTVGPRMRSAREAVDTWNNLCRGLTEQLNCLRQLGVRL